jgi:hypothetical protein
MSDERSQVAEEIRRLREAARATPIEERTPDKLAPRAREPQRPEAPLAPTIPEPPALPVHPDGSAVNQVWDLRPAISAPGPWRRLAQFVRRLMNPVIEAQTTFNSRQVQLDNQMLEYLDARFEATHRHYDAVLGLYGRHLQDVDKRHVILQEELVAHVHDLVRRIDLALSLGERTRVGLEAALRALRARLAELEERLGRE